jgi:ABC-type uncharacterized transport system substrate-binding protein
VTPFRKTRWGLRHGLAALCIVALALGPLGFLPGAQAQQRPVPVIGYLKTSGPSTSDTAFLQGLSETGYREGQGVVIERRSADGRYDRLPALASELVSRKGAVIVTSGGDPVRAGLVASLNRPGGNVTGVSNVFSTLTPKRVELLHQLVPRAVVLGALANPRYQEAALQGRELREAAAALHLHLHIVEARTPGEIDTAFTRLAHHRAQALLVSNGPFLLSRSPQIATLAPQQALPTIYWERESVAAGGLMSYGPSLTDAYRRGGIYTGRILGGAKPADLPAEQPTRFELVVNLKTAKALGLTIPPSVMVRADEVLP